jgi:anti-anti-sigma factor
MEIHQESRDGKAILRPSGRIDQNTAAAFQDALLAAMDGAKAGLVIDMAQVMFVSSVGLRALMVAARKAKSDGRSLAISGLTPTVKEVFAISRFTSVIPCHDDLGAALATMKT